MDTPNSKLNTQKSALPQGKKGKAAFFCDSPAQIAHVYARGRRERLETLAQVYGEVITGENYREHLPHLADCAYIFSTWGMPVLPEDALAQLPALRAVFYAAGSVQAFAEPYLRRKIAVVSAWAANGRPVAAFTLAQILLACKGYFRNTIACRRPAARRSAPPVGPGIFEARVALVGAGQIGRQVIELLRPFSIETQVVDPYLTPRAASELGVRLVSLEEAFCTATVVSNHTPNLPATHGMFYGELFRRLPAGATFINTGRGAQVMETELIAVAAERPDLTFLLDVTDPEPPLAASPLYTLPNIQLSSHIAGSLGTEVVCMADCVLDEFENLLLGRPLRYAVSLEMLATMA